MTTTSTTNTPGLLIVFEGIDGAGKTTQAGLLEGWLQRQGLEVTRTREPTNGQYGAQIRASATTGRRGLEEELQLFIDDRREHIETVIGPALSQGHVVIVDRYYFSTAAYQGPRGADVADILETNEDFAPEPDLLIFLDVEPKLGLSRVQVRDGQGNHFEQIDSLTDAAVIFRGIDRPYKMTLDASQSVEQLHQLILERLRQVDGLLFKHLCLKTSVEECATLHCGVREGCGYWGTTQA